MTGRAAIPDVTRLTLLCQPATAALRAGRFPADEPLDPVQAEEAPTLGTPAGIPDRVLCSPSRCARETAGSLGFSPEIVADLREVDYGRWNGLSLKQVLADEPTALAAWLADPAMNAHGGESLRTAIERAGRWLDTAALPGGHTLVIAPASMVKAIVLRVLGAPTSGYWQLDVAPLTRTTLTRRQGRWQLALGEVAA